MELESLNAFLVFWICIHIVFLQRLLLGFGVSPFTKKGPRNQGGGGGFPSGYRLYGPLIDPAGKVEGDKNKTEWAVQKRNESQSKKHGARRLRLQLPALSPRSGTRPSEKGRAADLAA